MHTSPYSLAQSFANFDPFIDKLKQPLKLNALTRERNFSLISQTLPIFHEGRSDYLGSLMSSLSPVFWKEKGSKSTKIDLRAIECLLKNQH